MDVINKLAIAFSEKDKLILFKGFIKVLVMKISIENVLIT